MFYNFQAIERAGQETMQRRMAEAEVWRRVQPLPDQRTQPSTPDRQFGLFWVMVVNWLIGH